MVYRHKMDSQYIDNVMIVYILEKGRKSAPALKAQGGCLNANL